MTMGHIIRKMMKDEGGSASIILAATMVVLLGMAALVVDGGMMYLQQGRLQNAADAAALAAAHDLPESPISASQSAMKYTAMNEVDPKLVSIQFSDQNRVIEVAVQQSVEFHFAKIFNMKDAIIQGRAKARVGSLSSTIGLRPLAVEHQIFEFGVPYTLKEGAGDGTSGNYAAIALGGTGSSVYKNNLIAGYQGIVKVGDVVDTETGNMSGSTFQGVKEIIQSDPHSPKCTYPHIEGDCPRVIHIPIVNSLQVNGKKAVKILGFGAFFVEDVVSKGGKTEIQGRFIRTLAQGAIDSAGGDYGVRGIKLVE